MKHAVLETEVSQQTIEVQTDPNLGWRFGRSVVVKIQDGQPWQVAFKSMYVLMSVDQVKNLRKALKKAIKQIEEGP